MKFYNSTGYTEKKDDFYRMTAFVCSGSFSGSFSSGTLVFWSSLVSCSGSLKCSKSISSSDFPAGWLWMMISIGTFGLWLWVVGCRLVCVGLVKQVVGIIVGIRLSRGFVDVFNSIRLSDKKLGGFQSSFIADFEDGG